ncbi:hypothetical protein ACQKII_09500 [Lysinibacillus sp. NPDC048646]|uniref:hypothetical protein n=1 Tax=Lysinibacillus sp. NPDC048646 TaxID=3390574 RepID=UPI003D057892
MEKVTEALNERLKSLQERVVEKEMDLDNFKKDIEKEEESVRGIKDEIAQVKEAIAILESKEILNAGCFVVTREVDLKKIGNALHEHVYKSKQSAQYKAICLGCGHSEVIQCQTIEDHKRKIDCPKCSGAFIDSYYTGHYKEILDSMKKEYGLKSNSVLPFDLAMKVYYLLDDETKVKLFGTAWEDYENDH